MAQEAFELDGLGEGDGRPADGVSLTADQAGLRGGQPLGARLRHRKLHEVQHPGKALAFLVLEDGGAEPDNGADHPDQAVTHRDVADDDDAFVPALKLTSSDAFQSGGAEVGADPLEQHVIVLSRRPSLAVVRAVAVVAVFVDQPLHGPDRCGRLRKYLRRFNRA